MRQLITIENPIPVDPVHEALAEILNPLPPEKRAEAMLTACCDVARKLGHRIDVRTGANFRQFIFLPGA